MIGITNWRLLIVYPRPDAIITDRLRSYRAALRELGGSSLHQAGRWLNNRAAGPATRTREAPFQPDAKPPEIRHRPCFRLQPLQPPTTPLFTGQFQAQPRRCTCPVASTRGGLIPCPRWNNSDLRFYSDSALQQFGQYPEQALQGVLPSYRGEDTKRNLKHAKERGCA